MENIPVYVHMTTYGRQYYLNVVTTKMQSKKEQITYFFSGDKRKTACAMPEGYEVAEGQNGLPYLKKKKTAQHP